MPYLGIFGLEIAKTVVIFQISTLKLSNCKFLEKTKTSKFGTKNMWFGYFAAGTWKQYCHIWNQQPRICLIAKYREITKMPKFGTKSASLEYFWARVLKKL